MIFEVFLIIGMVLMFLCMWFCGHEYSIPVWKIAIIAVLLTVFGYLGIHLMALIEMGKWDGRSYFGAVFLVPFLLWPTSKLLKLPYLDVMDISAPAGCIILALMKVKCKIDGCCYGRFFMSKSGNMIQFPSQIVEAAVAIALTITLVLLLKRQRWRGCIYFWYLVLYGATRIILNYFRATTPWVGPFASGTLWSIISVLVGVLLIIIMKKTKQV